MSTNKSFSTETSERYSRALFEVANEGKEIEKIENDVKSLLSLIKASPEIKNFIQNPTQSKSTQNQFIDILSKKLTFSKNFKNFLLLLIIKRRIFFVDKIFNSFLRLCSKKRGEVKASLISSRELSQTELDKISNEMSSSMGSILKLDYVVDKGLIGGLKLQLGSYMIDTSIKSKLKKYEQILLEN